MERISRPAKPRVRAPGAGLPVWLHVVALAIAVLAGIIVFPLASHGAPARGAVAPDFALKDLSGSNQRLSEFRGDIVVLTFWASWCGPCRETLAELRGIGAAQPEDRAVVISVNIEGDAERAGSVARSLGIDYATLLDSGQVGRLYDVSHLPLTLLLDRDGVVQGAWARERVSASELHAGIRELQQK
jgi:peroxiredoxin